MKVIKTVTLTNTKHGHNKSYSAKLYTEKGSHFILCEWGKVGGNMNKLTKGPFDQTKAEKTLNALLAGKKSSGYMEAGDANSSELPTHFGLPLFYPMKAREADTDERMEEMLADPKWIAEEKYDGSRYFLKMNKEGDIALHSRRVSVKTNLPVDRTENVPHIANELSELKLPVDGLILDGEVLWDHGAVGSVISALPEKSLARQKEFGWIYFMVYDIPYCDGDLYLDVPFVERRKMLEGLGVNGKFIRIAPQTTRYKGKFLTSIWDRKGEGIILKNPQGLYQAGDDPKENWVKVKKIVTDEFVVMGFKPGDKDGKYKNQVGSIVFGQYNKKGQLIPISFCSGFTDVERKAMTKNPKKYIGQVLEVKFNDISKGDDLKQIQRLVKVLKVKFKGEIPHSLRHPRFLRWRDDKNAKECKIKA